MQHLPHRVTCLGGATMAAWDGSGIRALWPRWRGVQYSLQSRTESRINIPECEYVSANVLSNFCCSFTCIRNWGVNYRFCVFSLMCPCNPAQGREADFVPDFVHHISWGIARMTVLLIQLLGAQMVLQILELRGTSGLGRAFMTSGKLHTKFFRKLIGGQLPAG